MASVKQVVVTKSDVELAKDEMLSKSERMRRLAGKGHSVGDIARIMGVRYNFVNNVLRGGGNGVSKNFELVIVEEKE
jgi:transposase-like protein